MNSTDGDADLFGYDVVDNSGNKIGTVDSAWVDDATDDLEFVGVKTGWLMGKIHVIPLAAASVDNAGQTITVPYGDDQVKNAPSFGSDDELSPDAENEIYSYYGLDRSTAPSPTGLAAGGVSDQDDIGEYGTTTPVATTGYVDETGTDTENVQLAEEQLQVGKRQVQAGQVRLRKVVTTEHVEEPVELRRETVDIERVPVSGGEVSDTAFQEDEIDVPLMREEPVVNKQATVTGQVQVNKTVTTETQTVGGDVRKEDVVVDDDDTTDDTVTSIDRNL